MSALLALLGCTATVSERAPSLDVDDPSEPAFSFELPQDTGRLPVGRDTGEAVLAYTEPDRDNDGLPDHLEFLGDQDGDGLDNIDDQDSDNDGILDGAETDMGLRGEDPLPPEPDPTRTEVGTCNTAVVRPFGLGWLQRRRVKIRQP